MAMLTTKNLQGILTHNKGKSLTYSGKVIQVIEGDTETQHRIAVNGDYDNVIYVAYPKNIVTSRFLMMIM